MVMRPESEQATPEVNQAPRAEGNINGDKVINHKVDQLARRTHRLVRGADTSKCLCWHWVNRLVLRNAQ